MNNGRARAALEEVRDAANVALNAMAAYVQAVEDGLVTSSTVKSREIARIKNLALSAGVDISAWDGKVTPG